MATTQEVQVRDSATFVHALQFVQEWNSNLPCGNDGVMLPQSHYAYISAPATRVRFSLL
jgi:hypothetical protein